MKKSTGLIFSTAVFCLLISGMAGLVYEIVWARYLALFLGHTSYAVVAVLVAFMGGLALGNVWFGARADRSNRPLALYAWLEIGIGLYALAFPAYYELCHHAYVALAKSWHPGSAGLLALKFVFSLLTILLPTALMGGTLPVLTKLVTRSLGELQARVAALYFINSVGAVAGILLADFWWIPTIGLQSTVLAGAAMNLFVGALALFVSGWIREGKSVLTVEPPPAVSHENEESFSSGELRLAIVGIGLSGFVAMLYEVVWTRLLALALGSSTHAFSLMLVTFISGIAVGAWMIGRWKKLRRTMEAFAWAEIALAMTLLASMFFYEYLPFWFIRLGAFLVRTPPAYPIYQFLQALICFSVMLIPSLCLGMTLPLVSRIATAELARTGRSVGSVFSINTTGTVLGAAVTGLWLLPSLGLARTLALGIAVNALVGLIVLLRHRGLARRVLLVASPVLAVATIWWAGWKFDDTWKRAFTLGLWRTPNPPTTLAEFKQMRKGSQLKFYRDGAGSTVSIHNWTQDNKEHLTLKVNGKADASTVSDVVTQLLSGHIPMLLRPQSQQALVIGLGSGMTCGAVMRHPSIQHLDAVEISPEVAEGARFFGPFNDNVLQNPRVRLVVEDAKSFLQIGENQYDVIISEPSNPWMAGVSGVFSREYYESCRRRLRPDGLMAQWVQIYETSNEALEMVLATFTAVFPYLSVWQGSIGDLILIGSTQPQKVDLNELEKRFAEPKVKADLERFDLFRLPVFLAREMITQQNALFIPPPDAPQHSDFYPTLEYVAQRAFFVGRGADLYLQLDENYSTRPGTLLARYLQKSSLSEDDFKAFALFFMTHRLPEGMLFRSLVSRWEQDFPKSIQPMEFSSRLAERRPVAQLEAIMMAPFRDQIFKNAEKDPEMLRLYAQFLMQTYRTYRSVFYVPPNVELKAALERLIETDRPNQRVHKLRLAEIAWDHGDDAACFEFGRAAFSPDTTAFGPIKFDLDPRAPYRVLNRMIETLWRAGKVPEAWGLCQDAKKNGYIGKKEGFRDPSLEVAYRRIETFVNQGRAPRTM